MSRHYSFLTFILVSLMPALVCAQDTIALWTFENTALTQATGLMGTYGPISPETGRGGLTRTASSGTYAVVFANAGNGNARSFTATNWATIGDNIQFRVNTVSRTNIQLKFEQAGPAAGARDFKVSYSTNGTAFTDVPNGSYQALQMNPNWNNTTYQSGYAYTFNLPAALNDAGDVYIRISLTSTTTVNGNTTGTSTNTRFDNVLVTGTLMPGVGPITNVAASKTSLCTSDGPVSVSFNTTTTVPTTYTAELSDASGSFATPVVIGSGTASPIVVTIPTGISNSANYRIRVTTPALISQNSAGPVSISSSPTFTSHPSDVTACEGGILNVEGQSADAQNFQWLYNGNLITGNPYAAYTVTTTRLSDAGNYRLIIGRNGCYDTSNTAVVTVNPSTMPNNATVSGSRVIGFGNLSLNLSIIAGDGSCGRLARFYLPPTITTSLGIATVTVTAGAPQRAGASGPWYVGRYYKVDVPIQPTAPVGVSFYFTPQDFTAYNQSAPPAQQIVVNQTAQTLGNLYFSRLADINDLGTSNGTLITPDSVKFENGYWKVSLTTTMLLGSHTFYPHGGNLAPCPTPTIAITPSANNTCSGTTVHFSATVTNPGTVPGYQWKVNGANVSTSSSYSYTPANGDTVICVLTNADCVNPTTATSNKITMLVSTPVTPDIAISASDTNVCSGVQVTYTATINHGGTTPAYQWKVNGTNTGSNSTTFIYTPNQGDIITCALTSNVVCPTSNGPVPSNPITMQVTPTVTPDVVISASDTSFCSGVQVTYTAAGNHGGSAPVYQWKVNGTNAGSGGVAFDYVPVDGDVISCELTSNASCLASNIPAVSNTITAHVIAPVTAAVNVTANPPGNVAEGTPIVYTANVSGTTVYSLDWYVNNQLIQQQQNPDNSITRPAGAVSDTVYVILKVDGCFTDSVYASNRVVVTPVTNIPKRAAELGLKFYPNPVLNYLTVEANGSELVEVQLLNLIGQTIQSEKAITNKKHVVNIAHFGPGVYYIKVWMTRQGKEYVVTEKIIRD